MGPECVVIPAPAISQRMVLGHRGEQLGVQVLIPWQAVEHLSKAVLPPLTWLYKGLGAAVLAPALQGVGDEFGPVVAPAQRWSWVEAGELIEHSHQVFGLAAPAHPYGQSEMALLVDHIDDLEPPAPADVLGINLAETMPKLASSRSTTLPTWRSLLRWWPTTGQTLCWDAR